MLVELSRTSFETMYAVGGPASQAHANLSQVQEACASLFF